MIIYSDPTHFYCPICQELVEQLPDGKPFFCDNCKFMYWVENGELHMRQGVRVDDIGDDC